ncbi:MAG: TIR domain-containing protein [Chloroflexi bacterium]|nr:TIR domain-containing protein [Chloroflexota bacterium]
MTEAKRPLKVFLCYAHADRDAVRALYTRLIHDGVDAWLDKENLLPGQDWELEIRKAVREASAIIVCLSNQFVQAGFKHKEVRWALDAAMERPEGEIFIIPARLEDCDTLEGLRKWHWVDLFKEDGYEKLRQALHVRGIIGGNKKMPPALKILVTGGREISNAVGKIAYHIGGQVIRRGHILINNGSIGVDRLSAEGALDACRKKSLSPTDLIQVIRPAKHPNAEFDFGAKRIAGETYGQRRDYVVDISDAVIVIAGGPGTLKVANRALSVKKPLIPIGIGEPASASYDLWHRILIGDIDSQIGMDVLRKLGKTTDAEILAVDVINLAEKLVHG